MNLSHENCCLNSSPVFICKPQYAPVSIVALKRNQQNQSKIHTLWSAIRNCFYTKHHDSLRLDRLPRITRQPAWIVCLFLTLATLVCLFSHLMLDNSKYKHMYVDSQGEIQSFMIYEERSDVSKRKTNVKYVSSPKSRPLLFTHLACRTWRLPATSDPFTGLSHKCKI